MAIKRHTPYSERVLFNWSISHMGFSANLISSVCPAVNAIAKSIYMKEGIRGTWTEEYDDLFQYVFHAHRTLSSRIFLTLVVVLCTTLLFVFNTFLLRISALYEARFNPYFANKHERHACCLFREERWNRKKNPAWRLSCPMCILAHKNAILLLSCVEKRGGAAIIYSANYPWRHGYRRSAAWFICFSAVSSR